MAASSSSPFFGIREEDLQNQMKHHQQQQQQQSSSTPSSSAAAAPPPVAQKKKRSLPGTPNPDAEVIALSPKTLMATNRFICEVCNKGFQREQNLQLHRRGHNLPWKLRQKSTKEVKRRVYLCPEPTCVHHDPSRALGDLTGIKKHFLRKHGEKKWKCDKCSKRYAVQSDWKAHSKTCGTREYRCDCGTLFSRRDSFITHRAFCDALAQESARIPTGLNTMHGSHLYGGSITSHVGLGLSQVSSQLSAMQDQMSHHPSTDLLRLGGGGGGGPPQFEHLLSNAPSTFRPPQAGSSPAFFLGGASGQDFQESQSHHHPLLPGKPFHGLMQLPDLQSSTATASSSSVAAAANLFNLGFFSNSTSSTSTINNSNSSHQLLFSDQFSNGGNASAEPAGGLFPGNLMGGHMDSGVSSLYNASVQSESVLPHMSATALLQKAAQMGATTSGNGSPLLRGFGSSSSSSSAKPTTFIKAGFGGAGGDHGMIRAQAENEAQQLQDMMNYSLANGGAGVFGDGGGSGVPAGAAAAFGGSCTGGGHDDQHEAAFGGFDPSLCSMDHEAKMLHHHHQNPSMGSNMGGSDRLTRDFLGVGSMVRSMSNGMPQRGEQQQQQQQQHHHHHHHHGIDIGSQLGSDMKSASTASRSFTGGNLH